MKRTLIILLLLSIYTKASSQNLEDIIEPAASKQKIKKDKIDIPIEKQYPTNFDEFKFEKIENYHEQILAFEIEIIKVKTSHKNTPYYKGKIGNKTIWVFSMINSEHIKKGNKVKVVGYLMSTDEVQSKHAEDKYHLLSFAVVNSKNMELDYFPGSEMQMKEWKEGKIPNSGE